MDKGAWQISTGIAALAAVGLGFALMATRGVLAQERNDRAPCPAAPEPETVVIRENAPPVTVHVAGMPIPDNVSCRGGVYLIKTEMGFESLTQTGRAIPCAER